MENNIVYMAKRDDIWDQALYHLVNDGSVSTRKIKQHVDASDQTIRHVLHTLEDKGYVERESNRHHTFHANDRNYLFSRLES
ncbi:DeoR family transcriptional regulator [Natrialba swarupiae]|nr:DeoR family transcriptional regulator [Natrialba swarupiae]